MMRITECRLCGNDYMYDVMDVAFEDFCQVCVEDIEKKEQQKSLNSSSDIITSE